MPPIGGREAKRWATFCDGTGVLKAVGGSRFSPAIGGRDTNSSRIVGLSSSL